MLGVLVADSLRSEVRSTLPNFAIRKRRLVQLIKNGKTAFVPGDGYLNCIDKNDDFLISGFSRRGKVVGDIPGIRFQVAYVAGVRFVCPRQLTLHGNQF